MDTTFTDRIPLATRLAQRQRPPQPVAMYQSWRELLFLHWSIDAEILQSRLPAGLTLDTFDGQAWIGIVPFFMRRIRPYWSPAIPGISDFQEVNVRTYVIDENGTPGVWFLSLDANTRLGVWWGSTLFGLPYHYAHMRHSRDDATRRIEFTSRRRRSGERLASHFVYQPAGKVRTAEPGSLEFFLVERYVMFTLSADSQILRGRVHHPPYEISDVSVQANDALFELNDLPRPQRAPDHRLLSRGVNVEIFALQPIAD